MQPQGAIALAAAVALALAVPAAAHADTAPPVITVPADITELATSYAGAAVTYAASAHDNVDGEIAPSCSPPSGSTFEMGQTTVRCTATDAAGNAGSASFTVTVTLFGTRPTLELPADIAVMTASPAGAAVEFEASARDAAGGALEPACLPASGSTFAPGATTVECSATDAAGTSASASFTVTVTVDAEPPVVTVPGNITLLATSPAGAAVTYAASATDNVDGELTPECRPASGRTLHAGHWLYRCHATDAVGNRGEAHFIVTIVPFGTPPTVTVPADMAVVAPSTGGVAVEFEASARDAAGNALEPTCAPASGSTFAPGATTVECSATDSVGTSASASFTVTLTVGTGSVTIIVPADMTVAATSHAGAVVTYAASARDAAGNALEPTCAPASGSAFPVGDTTVECSAANGRASASFTVTVTAYVDTVPPVITVPRLVTALPQTPLGAVVTYTVSAHDNIDGEITPTCRPASGSAFPLGATWVNCSATDAAGNTGTARFSVIVTDRLDMTRPVVTVPGDITALATSAAGATVEFEAGATDNIDGEIAPTCRPPSGSAFPVGRTTVECSATDDAGNTGSGRFAVTVTAFGARPALELPGDISVTTSSTSGAAVEYVAGATDAAGGALEPTCAPASGSTFAPGATTVECSATDAAGASASASFTVTVTVDTVAPVVTPPEDITVLATSPHGAVVTYTASATDNVDGEITPECRPHSGLRFPVGLWHPICYAVDAAGNRGTAEFAVTVIVFGRPPTVTVPADMAVEATSPAGAAVEFEAGARDAAGNALAPTCAPASGSAFPVGTTTVECSATDSVGTSASAGFAVTVAAYVDTVPPSITVPADMAVAATSGAGATVTYAAGATDNVDGEIAPACLPASGSALAAGETRVVCTATDAAGNFALAAFAVTVTPPGTPPSPPSITVPADMTVAATSPAGATVAYAASARDDADGSVTPACAPASGTTFAVGQRPVRCSASDSAGNSARAQFGVTVTPFEPPAQAGERLFLETFDSGLGRWTESGAANWRSGAHEGPRNPDGTLTAASAATVAKADDCDAGCTLELSSPVDLSGRTGATLALSRYVDRTLDAGEHLRVDVHSGGAWTTALEWTHGSGDDGLWRHVTHDLSSHLAADFKVRLVAATSTAGEDVAVDGVEVWATGGAAPADTAAPALTAPAGVTAAATSAAGAAVSYSASALDAVDGAVTPACRPASGSTFPVGETGVSCTATDTARNTASARFTVTVTPFAPPAPRGERIFLEDFGAATAPWAESGSPNWALGGHEGELNPDGTRAAGSGNDVARADNCDSDCTLTLVRPLDLSGRTGATLELSRYVDRALDAGEYLKVEARSNGEWATIMTWTHGSGDDGQWRHVTYDLAGRLTEDFGLRLVARVNSVGEDVAVDDLAVWATGG